MSGDLECNGDTLEHAVNMFFLQNKRDNRRIYLSAMSILSEAMADAEDVRRMEKLADAVKELSMAFRFGDKSMLQDKLRTTIERFGLYPKFVGCFT